MNFLVIKALHLIFVITWFAGLFYLVRLYVYHAEAHENRMHDETRFKILHEQFGLMERRLLFGITWPSAVLTLIFGGMLASQYWPLSDSPWLVIKLGLLVLLYSYHFSCHVLRNHFQLERPQYSSQHMRIWNEVPTLLLFGIVSLAVLRDGISMLWFTAGLIGLSIALMLAIKLYRQLRRA